MKIRFRCLGAAIMAAFFMPVVLHATGGGQVQSDTSFPIAGGNVATSSTISVRTDGFDWASVQLLVTSVTVPAQTFKDGSASTATITISSAPVGGISGLTFCLSGICAVATPLSTSSGTYSFGYDPLGYSTNTAQYLTTWINNNPQTSAIVKATCVAGSNVIYATSTANGVASNYSLYTSSQNAITLTAGPLTTNGASATSNMTGGTNAADVYLSTSLSLPNHNMATGLGIYISTTSAPSVAVQYATATPVGTMSRLTPGVTYYVTYVDPNTIGLALTSTGAVAGADVIFVSSNPTSSANSFTVNVPVIAGTPTLKWLVSNDNTNWTALTTSVFGQTIAAPASLSSYVSTGTLTWSDLGHLDASWLGLGVTAPTSGEINIKSNITGTTY